MNCFPSVCITSALTDPRDSIIKCKAARCNASEQLGNRLDLVGPRKRATHRRQLRRFGCVTERLGSRRVRKSQLIVDADDKRFLSLTIERPGLSLKVHRKRDARVPQSRGHCPPR